MTWPLVRHSALWQMCEASGQSARSEVSSSFSTSAMLYESSEHPIRLAKAITPSVRGPKHAERQSARIRAAKCDDTCRSSERSVRSARRQSRRNRTGAQEAIRQPSVLNVPAGQDSVVPFEQSRLPPWTKSCNKRSTSPGSESTLYNQPSSFLVSSR